MEFENQKFVLVLGGSSFMGLTLLKKLSEEKNTQIYYINRGKKYWNFEVKKIQNINYVNGDRREKVEFSKLLKYTSFKLGIKQDSDKKWDIIYDFSALKPSHVQSVLLGIEGLFNLYVFISSDSVYDVCDPKIRTDDLIVEKMALRPNDEKFAKRLSEEDSYAEKKMLCEEFLQEEVKQKNKDFPFIILRLPDVIGPFDDTGRFWSYVKWVSESQFHPVIVNQKGQKNKMSFVFSQDLIDLLLNFLHQGESLYKKNLYQSFNICFDEQVSTLEILEEIKQNVPNLELNIEIKYDTYAPSFYPSVECGPISNQKAQNQLNWKPTNFSDAIRQTVQFFLQAKNYYKEEEYEAEKKLKKKLRRD